MALRGSQFVITDHVRRPEGGEFWSHHHFHCWSPILVPARQMCTFLSFFAVLCLVKRGVVCSPVHFLTEKSPKCSLPMSLPVVIFQKRYPPQTWRQPLRCLTVLGDKCGRHSWLSLPEHCGKQSVGGEAAWIISASQDTFRGDANKF